MGFYTRTNELVGYPVKKWRGMTTGQILVLLLVLLLVAIVFAGWYYLYQRCVHLQQQVDSSATLDMLRQWFPAGSGPSDAGTR